MGVRIDGSNDVVSAVDGTLTVDGLSLNVAGIITASGGFKVGSAVTISSNGNATFSGITTFGDSVHTGIGVSVGIGTDIPEHALVVRDTGLARLRIRNDTASSENYASLNLKTAGFDNGWSVYSEYKSSDADNYLKIFKGDGTATHMYFQDPNEVGIRSAFYHVDANGDDQGDSCFGFIANSANPGFKIKSGGTERLRLDSSGRLLLGTTTEGAANADNLTIADSGHAGITIRSGTSSNGAVFFSDATSGSGEFEGVIEYQHNNNDMVFFTSGSEAIRIDSSQNIGIGTTSPNRLLHLQAASSTAYSGGSDTADYNFLKIENITDDKSAGVFFQIGSNGEAAITAIESSDGATDIAFQNRGGGVRSEKLRITSGGQVRIGSFGAPSNKNSVTPLAHVDGSGVNGGFQVNRHTSVGGGGAQLLLSATRGSSITGHTVLQDNDGIGSLVFAGSDGGEFVTGAEIQAVVDGTPGNDNLPAELMFKTNSGAAGPTERMRILSGGGLTFNGDTAQANALDDYEEGTWTPAFSCTNANFSYSDQSGLYIKIGKLVIINFRIQLTSRTDGTGALNITGLPFTPQNNRSVLSISPTFGSFGSNNAPIGGFTESGGILLKKYDSGDARDTADTNVDPSIISSAGIIGSMAYIIA